MSALLTERQWAKLTREAGALARTGSTDGERRTWLYFARVGEAVKIGHAGKPATRLRLLRVDNAADVEVVALVRGTVSGERAVHEKFDHLRLRGEWFEAAPELLTFAHLCQLDEDAREVPE